MISRFQIFLTLLLLFCCVPIYCAEGSAPKTVPIEIYEDLQQEIIRLKEADRIRDLAMKNLIRRIEQLERAASIAPASSQLPTVAESAGVPVELSTEVKQRLEKESEDNYQLIRKAFEQRLSKEGGMLLAPYHLTYEPSLSYSHASYDSIVVDGFTVYPVLVIGDIVAERVRRDILTNSHTFRLGLPQNMQFDLIFPFGYERKRSFRDDGTHQTHETDGLGDITLALSYQLIGKSKFWPDTVVGVSWKSQSGEDPYTLSNTDAPALGTGFDTWGFSMTSIATADPMVLFGGISASYTPGSDKPIGHVDPGESFGINLGMALALNLDCSLSFSYSYNYTLETEIDKRKIYGTDQATSTFGIGFSRAESDFYAMDMDLAIGLTRDSTDFQFTISLPFEFFLRDF